MAVKVTLVPVHIAPAGLAAIVTEGTRFVVTDMAMGAEVAVKGETQAALEGIITVTASPLFKEDEVKVVPPDPAFTPFTCH